MVDDLKEMMELNDDSFAAIRDTLDVALEKMMQACFPLADKMVQPLLELYNKLLNKDSIPEDHEWETAANDMKPLGSKEFRSAWKPIEPFVKKTRDDSNEQMGPLVVWLAKMRKKCPRDDPGQDIIY